MIAPDGRCKTLDAAADGYVRAETCRAMYLMPPSQGSITYSSASNACDVLMPPLQGSTNSNSAFMPVLRHCLLAVLLLMHAL